MVTWLQVAAQLLLERWKCRLEILFMLSAARRGSHQKCFGWSLLILSPCSECVIFFLREHPSQMCRIKRGFGWPVIRLVGGKTWPQLRRWIPWNKWHRPSVESKPGMICSENAIAPTYAILLHFMLSSYGSPRRLHWGSASDAQRCQCADFIFELRHGIISAIPPAAHGVHLHTPSDAKCLQLKVRANVSTLSSTVGRHIALNIFDSTLIMNIFGTPVFCNTFAWN